MIRMEESDPAKKVLCTKPAGSGDRRRGRPKLRRCDELEEEVARVGCKNWRINAVKRGVTGTDLGGQVSSKNIVPMEEEEEVEMPINSFVDGN